MRNYSKGQLNIIKILVIVFLISTLIVSSIISQDEYHLEICHDEHCTYCIIIHIAQNIISLSIAFIYIMHFSILIYFFLSRLRITQNIFVLSSLVFQKVQLNE